MMTDTQAQIVIAMRRSNTAMTQTEIAKATNLDAGQVLSDVLALGAAGYIRKAGSFYALIRARR
jgi:DNA-binding Lrp family transcriptional regulator